MKKTIVNFAVCSAFFAATAPSHAAGDGTAGAALYKQRCAVCHSIDYNGVGPSHRGVFGRGAGQLKGFAFSDALKGSKQVWSDETLDRWLADPEKFAPGQRMGVNLPDAKERADVIEYLRKAAAPAASAAPK